MFQLFKFISAVLFVLTANIKADSIPVMGKSDKSLEPFDKLMKSFLSEHNIPGAALAITKDGRLIYAKGFGWANREMKQPVKQNSLFRIASLSKAITGSAIMRLSQEGKLHLSDDAVSLFDINPWKNKYSVDQKWKDITVKHLLQHEAGWIRKNDPIGSTWKISKKMKKRQSISNRELISYMMSQPLEFSPGSKYSYSNFGYAILGRIIEDVSHSDYEQYVQHNILRPLGITSMQIGSRAPQYRVNNEVKYYDPHNKTAIPSFGINKGRKVPRPYAGNELSVMDAAGGWIASAPDIARFMTSFDNPKNSPVLKESTIKTMFARKDGPACFKNGKPKNAYYSCGWMVRPKRGGMNTYHFGSLPGTSTAMVRRHDGLNWVVLFNMRHNKDYKQLAPLIDTPLHHVANKITDWPKNDLFHELGYK